MIFTSAVGSQMKAITVFMWGLGPVSGQMSPSLYSIFKIPSLSMKGGFPISPRSRKLKHKNSLRFNFYSF